MKARAARPSARYRRAKRLLATAVSLGRSVAGAERGVAILAYHDTYESRDDPWWTDFRGQLSLLDDLGYRIVSLSTAVEIISGQRQADGPTVAITFDDGCTSNLDVAFPELAKRRWPATVFVPTSYLGRDRFLRPEQVARLRDFGVEVGNHTHGHPDLRRLAREEIAEEIEECTRRLIDLTGVRPRHFCYPDGRYSPTVRDVVAAAGMESACSSRVGRNRLGQDRFLLRRLTIDPGDGPRELKLRLAGGYDFLDWKQRFMDRDSGPGS